MATFQLFFQSREQVVVRRGQIRRICWVIKTLEAQVGQFLLGCKCLVRRGIVVQEQEPLGELPAAFFFQSVLQLHRQRWVILRVDNMALWKIINEENAILTPKNRGENFSNGFLPSEFLGAGWAAMPPFQWLLLCLRVIVIKPGFVHGHQSRQEIIWIVNLINNLRGGQCFGSSRTRRITGGKITTFKLGHPILTMAYDCACSPKVSFRMAWISFGALPCRKKIDNSSRLDVVEIARVAWHASFQTL